MIASPVPSTGHCKTFERTQKIHFLAVPGSFFFSFSFPFFSSFFPFFSLSLSHLIFTLFFSFLLFLLPSHKNQIGIFLQRPVPVPLSYFTCHSSLAAMVSIEITGFDSIRLLLFFFSPSFSLSLSLSFFLSFFLSSFFFSSFFLLRKRRHHHPSRARRAITTTYEHAILFRDDFFSTAFFDIKNIS